MEKSGDSGNELEPSYLDEDLYRILMVRYYNYTHYTHRKNQIAWKNSSKKFSIWLQSENARILVKVIKIDFKNKMLESNTKILIFWILMFFKLIK